MYSLDDLIVTLTLDINNNSIYILFQYSSLDLRRSTTVLAMAND